MRSRVDNSVHKPIHMSIHKPMHIATALVLIVVSAFANSLSFPPWDLRPLAFVSLVPLLLAIRSGGLGRAMTLAAAWCLLYAWLIASVFPASLASYYERPLWFGVVAALLIFFSMAAIYYATFAAVDRLLVRSAGVFTPLLVAAAWAVAELGRGRLFTGTPFFIGNPWGLIGYSHASGPLAQFASVAGVYGIGFTIFAVNAGLAGLIGAWRDRAARRTALIALGLAVLPAIGSAVYGSAVLRAAPDPASVSGLREIAIVQGNVSIDRRWRSDFHAKNLDVYLALTARAAHQGAPELIIWPETAMNFFIEGEAVYRGAITRVIDDGQAALLAGGPSASSSNRPPYFNSVFLVEPKLGLTQRYDKEYLVPFSEYVPTLSFDWMQRRIDGARVFEPGPQSPAPLETAIGRAGMLICNEAMLPEIAGDRVRAGAEILISPSNDTWIRGRAFAEHMLAVVALRAIETRRYLARVSTAGPSAVVDPWGRVMARTDAGTAAVLSGWVRPETELTPYARFGDAFTAVCLAAVAVALLGPAALARIERLRARGSRPQS